MARRALETDQEVVQTDLALETLKKHAIANQEYVKVTDAIKDKKYCGVLPGHHPAQKFKSYWDALTIEPTLPGLVLYHGRIWVPAKARSNILNKLHKDHCEPERCIQKAKNYYFWPKMAKDIKSVISGCEKCITYSASKPRGPNIATVANRPFEKISMDYAEFKKHYYLVIVDRYSRIPMVARTRGMTTKHVLPVFQEWISYYGKPTHVRTDGGPCFRHRDFSKWCQDKDDIHEVSSPHNHERNGQAERAIREIKNLLKKTDGHWETFQEALTEYKNCPGYDGLAPTQWAFGRLQRTSVPGPSKSYDRVTDYELKEHLGRRGCVQRQKNVFGPRYSPSKFNPGDKIRVQDDKTKHWTKQAIVVKKLNQRSYLLKSGSKTFRRNVRFIKAAPVPSDVIEEKDDHCHDNPGSSPGVRRQGKASQTSGMSQKGQGISNPLRTSGPMTRSHSKGEDRQQGVHGSKTGTGRQPGNGRQTGNERQLRRSHR